MPWIQTQARLPRLLSSCAGQVHWAGISPTLPNILPLSPPSQWLTQLIQEKYVSPPLSLALHFFVTFLDQKKEEKKKERKSTCEEHRHQGRREPSIFQNTKPDEKSVLPNRHHDLPLTPRGSLPRTGPCDASRSTFLFNLRPIPWPLPGYSAVFHEYSWRVAAL